MGRREDRLRGLVKEYREALNEYGDRYADYQDYAGLDVDHDFRKALDEALARLDAAVRALIAEAVYRSDISDWPMDEDERKALAKKMLPLAGSVAQ